MQAFEIELKVILKSDLHTAGPGRTLPLVDRCVEVDERGNPMIPATSFRGRVRAQLERLLGALGERVCQPPNPENMCPHSPPGALPNTHCRACRIFGNAWRQTQVFFSDLKSAEDILTDQRTGIGINRFLNTVEEQRLFVIETVPKSFQSASDTSTFAGRIDGWLSREDLAWLLVSLRTLTHIGGGKGRGLGRVIVEISGVRLKDDSTTMADIDVESLLSEVFK